MISLRDWLRELVGANLWLLQNRRRVVLLSNLQRDLITARIETRVVAELELRRFYR